MIERSESRPEVKIISRHRRPFVYTPHPDSQPVSIQTATNTAENSDTSLLTAKEEKLLGKMKDEGYLAQDQLTQTDDPIRQKELQEKIRLGQAAAEKLYLSNTGLVRGVVKKYLPNVNDSAILSFDDLEQEGKIGLLRAVQKFDWKKGFRFSTYATWWIRQAVSRAINGQSEISTIPVHLSGKITKLHRDIGTLEQELNRYPTLTEIAEDNLKKAKVTITEKKVKDEIKRIQKLLSARPTSVSLDNIFGREDEDNNTYAAQLIDPSVDVETEAINHTSQENLNQSLLDDLSPREFYILQCRYGDKIKTLEELGIELGVSRERIRQIEEEALAKLRKNPKYRSYLNDNNAVG